MQADAAQEAQQPKDDGCGLGVEDHADAIAHDARAETQHDDQYFRQRPDVYDDAETQQNHHQEDAARPAVAEISSISSIMMLLFSSLNLAWVMPLRAEADPVERRKLRGFFAVTMMVGICCLNVAGRSQALKAGALMPGK
jgi:hypothetical protein